MALNQQLYWRVRGFIVKKTRRSSVTCKEICFSRSGAVDMCVWCMILFSVHRLLCAHPLHSCTFAWVYSPSSHLFQVDCASWSRVGRLVQQDHANIKEGTAKIQVVYHVSWGGGFRLWRSLQRILLPPLTRVVQPILWLIWILGKRHLHSSSQPCISLCWELSGMVSVTSS